MRDWWSNVHNWRFCQVQSHMTQKLGHLSKIWPDEIYILCPSLRIRGQLRAPIVNGGENRCWKWRISNCQGLVTLTLHRVILHTVVHRSSTSTYMPNFTDMEETFCGRMDRHLRPNKQVVTRLELAICVMAQAPPPLRRTQASLPKIWYT